jgi:biopolymer transport protein TolR
MMTFRRKRRELPVNAEINLTNLIDVAFVLLIIFMITAPILQGGIELQLPEADARPLDTAEAVTVSIARDGTYYVEKAKVGSLRELEAVLKTYTGDDKDRPVTVSGDRRVEYGYVAAVLGLINRMGLTPQMIVDPRRER